MTNLTIQPTEPAADGAWAKVPAGLHQCPGISHIEDIEASDAYPTDGRRYKIYLPLPQFLDEDNHPVVLHAYCSQKLNAKTKLWKWLGQLGFSLVAGGPVFNLGQLIGQPCTVTVSIADSANGPRPKVTDLWPPVGMPAAASQAPAQQAVQQGVQVQPDDTPRCETCDGTDDPEMYATSKGKIFCSQHGPRAEM